MLHFAYGSNLKIEFLKTILPNAKYVMKACIPNSEIQYSFWSKTQQAGISNIMHVPGKMVHGALFETTEEEMIALDTMEGIYVGDYSRKTFLALGEDGKWYPSELYQVIDPQGPFKPSESYVKGMLEGAKELELDADYIKVIEKMYADSKVV
ncbi:MAG: hypothetical protein OFPII_30210 [Osedax symbiont Rs1]|nr:MAG: hypothetical protein OFPII_30210 [Osedax symbiont Rs1]